MWTKYANWHQLHKKPDIKAQTRWSEYKRNKVGQSETNRNKHKSQKGKDASVAHFKNNEGNSPAIKNDLHYQPRATRERSGHDDGKRDDCTYIIKKNDSKDGHMPRAHVDKNERNFDKLTGKNPRSKIQQMFKRNDGTRVQKSPPKTWGSKSVSKCSKHFRNGVFVVKEKKLSHFCFNEACWNGFSRKPCDLTMHVKSLEQCARAVTSNPACGMEFSYYDGSSFCDCAPVGGHCTPKAVHKANILEFAKRHSYPAGIIRGATTLPPATNVHSSITRESPSVPVVLSSKPVSSLQMSTTTRYSVPSFRSTISTAPLRKTVVSSQTAVLAQSPKSTFGSYAATSARATRVGNRQTNRPIQQRHPELTRYHSGTTRSTERGTTPSTKRGNTASSKRDTSRSAKRDTTTKRDNTASSKRDTTRAIEPAIKFSTWPWPWHSSVQRQNPTSPTTIRPSTKPKILIPSDCISWFDGCRSCLVQDGQVVRCTRNYCYGTKTYCRKFKDGRVCQSPNDCHHPSEGSTPSLRTATIRNWNMTALGNTTLGNYSTPMPDIVFNFVINVPFLVTMLVMAATTVILLAILIFVGSFVLTKKKRKRQRQVTANRGGTLRQNAPITKHLKQLRSALAKHPKAIQWSEDGKSFYVPNRQRFECDVLGDPALGFKTQSFKNWAQKLRRHGFKLHKGTGGKVVGGRYSREDGLFTRDHPELDGQIPRVKTDKKCKTSSQPFHLVDKLRAAFILYPRIIQWTEDGLSFRVHDLRGFESKVLTDKKVGFRCSTYRNWARNLRNYGFQAVGSGKGKKGKSRRVWRHCGGQFERDRPEHFKCISDVHDTKRCKIDSDGRLLSATIVVSEVVTQLPPPPPLFSIGQLERTKTNDLTCGRLRFDESAMLESASLISFADDAGSLPRHDSYLLFDHDHQIDRMAVNDIGDLLSTNESDLQLQLRLCEEDYELCI